MYFKTSQKVIYYLGYFWEKICCQELSKIAQSGHTDHKARLPNAIIKILKIFFPHNTPIFCYLLIVKLSDLLGNLRRANLDPHLFLHKAYAKRRIAHGRL